MSRNVAVKKVEQRAGANVVEELLLSLQVRTVDVGRCLSLAGEER